MSNHSFQISGYATTIAHSILTLACILITVTSFTMWLKQEIVNKDVKRRIVSGLTVWRRAACAPGHGIFLCCLITCLVCFWVESCLAFGFDLVAVVWTSSSAYLVNVQPVGCHRPHPFKTSGHVLCIRCFSDLRKECVLCQHVNVCVCLCVYALLSVVVCGCCWCCYREM